MVQHQRYIVGHNMGHPMCVSQDAAINEGQYVGYDVLQKFPDLSGPRRLVEDL